MKNRLNRFHRWMVTSESRA